MEYRLFVFYKVAKLLSFSKASEELYISQPAVTRHIRELESKYKAQLFERKGNRNVLLTKAGKILFEYAEQMEELSRNLNFEMNHLANDYSGILKIGASSTVAQYVLPRYLARFHKRYPNIKIYAITGNSIEMQKALLNKEINLGIIEDSGKVPELHYEDYLNDEIVLICPMDSKIISRDCISITEIVQYPLLLRENGSGTLKIISDYLSKHGIKISQLKIEMQLGSTEAIKNYLFDSNCMALVSIHAVFKELKEQTLKIIEIEEGKIIRNFRFIELQGQNDALCQLFKSYIRSLSL
ncbi:LysR substrate-binding domain-containing protein [Weeksellaceae bacterium A-14]